MNHPKSGIDAVVIKTPLHPRSPDELPDDVGLLKAMLWEVLASHDELSQQNAWLKRALWGKKSERLVSPEQMALFKDATERLGMVPGEPGDENHEHVSPEELAGEASGSTDAKGGDGKPARMPTDRPKTRRGGALGLQQRRDRGLPVLDDQARRHPSRLPGRLRGRLARCSRVRPRARTRARFGSA